MPVRWLLGAALLVAPYFWLGRAWRGGKREERQYSYAE
jgi:hypothetical protein